MITLGYISDGQFTGRGCHIDMQRDELPGLLEMFGLPPADNIETGWVRHDVFCWKAELTLSEPVDVTDLV